jgi:hypothetical protein
VEREAAILLLPVRLSLPSMPTSAASFFLICPNFSKKKWKNIDPLSFKYEFLPLIDISEGALERMIYL